MLPWNEIHTVFLDMDGTLLDLRFDNHFWLEYMPRRYGEAHDLDPERARAELMARYRSVEGTLNWYCLDYWSRELAMDLRSLKREVEHLIAVRPFAIEFLETVHNAGKRVLLVTNAHPDSLRLKMEKTCLQGHFDRIISSHTLGLPKEHVDFWFRLRQGETFDPARTMLVDDSLSILRTARDYGIAYLISVLKPDSARPPETPGEFPAIQDFSELLLLNRDQYSI
jgi:HAD superfamily hydrolase (TIGR01509 family)